MTALDPQSADRLAKLLGMLGSAHAGERDSAGLKASELIRSRGLTWFDVLRPTDRQICTSRESDEALIGFAMAHAAELDDWPLKFILSIRAQAFRRRLTPKQRAKLEEIAADLRRAAA